MAVKARLIKGCAHGHVGREITVDLDEFEYLRKHGYAALIKYETCAKATPEKRGRGRPKKK